MVSTKIFTGDGSTKIFPIEFEIKGEDYIQIWLDNVAVNDRTTYDIINNSIVFLNDYIPDNGVKVEIVVASTAQEIADLNAPTSTVQLVSDNIDSVIIDATNIDDINTNASNIDNINTNATNIDNINTTATNIANINTNVNNINAINTNATNINAINTNATNINAITTNATNINAITNVATEVVPNIDEILLADDNAQIASTKADEASASAVIASTKADEASASAVIASTKADEASASAVIASTKADEASASAVIASTKADEASASASSASTSETASANNATASALSATNSANSATASANSASSSATSESNASSSATLAEKYANEDEDVAVETGKYSAYHWSEKAKKNASGSAVAISYDNIISGLTATDVQGAIDEVVIELDSVGTAAYADVTTSSTDATAGRITKVGDFGLGAMTPTLSDANVATLGSFQTSGQITNLEAKNNNFPYISIASDGTLMWWNIETFGFATRTTQIANQAFIGTIQPNYMYTRTKHDSTWSDWKQLATTDSPALIGTPTAPTPTAGDNSTKIATTEFVKANASTATVSVTYSTHSLYSNNSSANSLTVTAPTGYTLAGWNGYGSVSTIVNSGTYGAASVAQGNTSLTAPVFYNTKRYPATIICYWVKVS
jgi:hypothetical protein